MSHIRKAALLAALFGAHPLACKHEAPPAPRHEPRAAPQASQAFAQRLRTATEGAAARWAQADDLPDCKPFLKQAEPLKACGETRIKIRAFQGAIPSGASPETLMHLAADVALSAQRTAQALRETGVTELLQGRLEHTPSASASAPSARASASALPPPIVSAPSKPRAAPSSLAHHDAPVREQKAPVLDAILAYARIATLGLSEVRPYLEFGTPEQRRTALSELARLSHQQPVWAGLRALAHEATLVETDPALKGELSRLAKQLGDP